ncbi:SNF2 helicase associated domain-containing protein [Heyndrickxia acidicola]|uniref:SNF2 helicase associated domain-containing protein n=1 Tax=Heyndrickxia acidicola TaxID=209389 RepID=UPI00399D4258
MPTSFLSKDEIKIYYTNQIFKRGESYFYEGRVADIKEEPEEHSWTVKVKGSEMYIVSITYHRGNLSTYCECMAYEKYGECKHEVAALLGISQLEMGLKNESILHSMQYEKTDKFMELFTNIQQTAIETTQKTAKKPLTVEFICTLQRRGLSNSSALLAIQMKVGVDRLYVVRNMNDFLQKVENGQEHEFTKKFSYEPDEHYFIKEDKEILSLLQGIRENENLYSQTSTFYWAKQSNNDKEMIIPPLAADTLFAKLIDRGFVFEYFQETFESIKFKDGMLPFSFEIQALEGDEDFLFSFDELKDMTYLHAYGWLFYKGSFYRPDSEKKDLIKELLEFQTHTYIPELRINRSQMGSFLSNVLPGLRTLGKVELDSKMAEHIQQPALHTKIFIEEKEKKLYLRLEYHYGAFAFNPFDEEQKDPAGNVILIRDSEKEQEIMSIIEHSSLKFNGKQLYLEDDPDSIYEFMYYILPELQDKAEILMAGEIESYFRQSEFTPTTTIDVGTQGNYLEVNFDIQGIDRKEIDLILRSIVEKKRYYRLSDGQFISLENEEFRSIDKLIEELNIRKKEFNSQQIYVPLYRGLQVDDVLNTGNKYAVKMGKGFRKLIHHLKNPEDNEYDIPDSLQATLREYQKTGFQWLKSLSHYQFGGILADDMGLGKTLQSISFILSLMKQNNHSASFLVVAPASLVYNWKSEFNKFAPDIKTEVIAGGPKERRALLEKNDNADVLITSYPTLRQDIDFYEHRVFDTIILDEAQVVKNPITKTAAAVRQIQARQKFALSGTPIENSLDELWSIFQIVLPGFFPSQLEFRRMPQEKISRMVRPFILRRLKKDVLKELPPKIETNHYSELTKSQKELYLAYLDKIQKEAVESMESDGFNKNRIRILAGLTRLRQLCCHPSLFIENYQKESGKLEALLEIVKNAMESGKRLLIFSQFSSMLKLIDQRLKQEGIANFYLDGQTPSQDRLQMADRFNSGEKDVFLISLKAGGTGLNLTGADTVILYDLWWNPAVEEQAAGRAHRIGQKNVVQVIRLIARGTIEEKIYEIQQKKKELIEKVVQPGDTMLSSLSESDIRELLSI